MSDTTELLTGPAGTPDATPATAGNTGGASGGAPAAAARPRRRSGTGLAAMLLPELQRLAQSLGISGTGRMRKSQLVEAIQERAIMDEPAADGRGPDRGSSVSAPATARAGSGRLSRLALSIQTQPNGARLREPVTPVLMSRTLCNQKHPYRLIMAPVQVPATSSSPSAGTVRVGRAPVRALGTAQLHLVHRHLRQAHQPAARLPERPSRALAGPAASSRVTRR